MKELSIEINKRIKEINALITQSTTRIRKYSNYEDIHVQSNMSRGRNQFYYIDKKTHKKEFIKGKDMKRFSKYIQRDYDFAVNKKLLQIQKKLMRIEKDIQGIDLGQVKEIYEMQTPSKKSYITPIIPSDEDFIARWYEEHKGAQNTFPIEGNIYTERGEHVRSKSEKILADLFYKYDIPYVYEPKIKMNNGHMVCPDFALLNKETRQTIYWEHLGLINQDEYAVRNLEKLHEYEESSLILGENLLISMESTKKGLNTKLVEMQIKKKINKSL